mgnify:CR=1 FL=1
MLKRDIFATVLAGAVLLMQTTRPGIADTSSGAASATRVIDGAQLPPPPEKFGGDIEEQAMKSTPWWPPRKPRQSPLPACCGARMSASLNRFP